MLEWISVHWHSRAGPAAALRIYKEATGARIHHPDRDVACHAVPFGLARFPKELEQMPRRCVVLTCFFSGPHPAFLHARAHRYGVDDTH